MPFTSPDNKKSLPDSMKRKTSLQKSLIEAFKNHPAFETFSMTESGVSFRAPTQVVDATISNKSQTE